MAIYCTKCGKQLEDNIKFCTECGEKLVSETTSNETELFFSPKESIRKTGEKNYGKGSLKITDKNLYI